MFVGTTRNLSVLIAEQQSLFYIRTSMSNSYNYFYSQALLHLDRSKYIRASLSIRSYQCSAYGRVFNFSNLLITHLTIFQIVNNSKAGFKELSTAKKNPTERKQRNSRSRSRLKSAKQLLPCSRKSEFKT